VADMGNLPPVADCGEINSMACSVAKELNTCLLAVTWRNPSRRTIFCYKFK
jgi:hypothetical protein